MNKRNKILKNFIVIEGLDGAGTTTLSSALVSHLNKIGVKTLATREPSDGDIGKTIREAYLSKKKATTPKALALLYSADREDHINNPTTGVKQLLKDAVVISDRYFYSSLAYQGVNLDFDYVNSINDFEEPEIIIYIDTPVDECLARIERRGDAKELFEKKDFLEKTRDNYEKAFSQLESTENFYLTKIRVLKIDGTKSKDDVFKTALSFLEAYFLPNL